MTDEVKDSQSKENLKKFFSILNDIMKLGKNSEMHIFLLREIVHRHGYRELQKIIKNSEYNLLDDQLVNQQV